MRDVKVRYWLAFVGFKLVALGVYFATGFSPLLLVALCSSIPWWFYIYGLWPFSEVE